VVLVCVYDDGDMPVRGVKGRPRRNDQEAIRCCNRSHLRGGIASAKNRPWLKLNVFENVVRFAGKSNAELSCHRYDKAAAV
jgi:hypothetical protein